MSGATVVSAVAIVSTGLMAGLFFGWSVSVIPGTRLVDDRTYVATMQQINRAILNPAFVIPFLATPLLLVSAGVLHWRTGHHRAAVSMAVAAVVYIAGLLGVTGVVNVPLNNALDVFELATSNADEIRARRRSYESRWNRWHTVRTGAIVLAFGCAAIATTLERSDSGE